MKLNSIPLALYIHIPWCIKKCPYCDFNSHAVQGKIPEADYVKRLLVDLENDLPLVPNRTIYSIFIGGGTPSLFSAKSIELLLKGIQQLIPIDTQAEITLEANPGTMEHRSFTDYRLAGINRVSLGVQSFQDDKLQALGRIHQANECKKAIESLHNANLTSFNLDLMYGLPQQTLEDALYDLKTALQFCPPHLSWYNLTIEPNTIFHHKPPVLPADETLLSIEAAGKSLLEQHKLFQYEVSAFAQPKHQCQHNRNYWEFGDYLGIGAGAHGKITNTNDNVITRYWKTRYPKSYLSPDKALLAGKQNIKTEERPFEFMLNALRLTDGLPIAYLKERTGLSINTIATALKKAQLQGLLEDPSDHFIPTALGNRFLNDLVLLFSPPNS